MNPFISIVTGTYNRIKYLQQMVESTRSSVGVGIPYEIVVVDGGSTDGTINWCKIQKDIVLIQHGELLGAVKAFNDGARISVGTYVILANDDITFINESIQCAIVFMQDNPDVGIGCFYQDRRGWDWHVEEMPAVKDGKQISHVYGQVCIVPKWLGDMVGWWGDYLRTYGGDNELSCNVLELGYKIKPVPCACIHDATPSDELRIRNNDAVAEPGKNHPDTQKWLDKWTRNGKTGPNIKTKPEIAYTVATDYRIVYAPVYEPGHVVQRIQKHGLRDSLAKISLVTECDYVKQSVNYVFDLANIFHPDMILLQVHSIGVFTRDIIAELRKEHPNALLINWNGDYHPENLYDSAYMNMLKLFDMTGLVTTEVASKYNKEHIKWFYWQIGYENVPLISNNKTAKHDVIFMGNGYSEARLELVKALRQHLTSFGLYGMWPPQFRPNGNTLYDFEEGHKLYKNCKIAIGDSQWPHATGFVSNRLFQSMAAGAFLLQQSFDGMEELLGLKDGVHLVCWDNVDDLLEKIEYYIKNNDERKKIADAGHKFIIENHSFDVRVKELFKALK